MKKKNIYFISVREAKATEKLEMQKRIDPKAMVVDVPVMEKMTPAHLANIVRMMHPIGTVCLGAGISKEAIREAEKTKASFKIVTTTEKGNVTIDCVNCTNCTRKKENCPSAMH